MDVQHARHVHPGVGRPAAGALAPLPATHPRPGDRPGQADRARRPARQGTARQLQPAPRRLQRRGDTRTRACPRRSRPGGHARPDPRSEKSIGERALRISTYATLDPQAIQRGLENSGRTIRLPVHVAQRSRKVGRSERELWGQLGHEPRRGARQETEY